MNRILLGFGLLVGTAMLATNCTTTGGVGNNPKGTNTHTSLPANTATPTAIPSASPTSICLAATKRLWVTSKAGGALVSILPFNGGSWVPSIALPLPSGGAHGIGFVPSTGKVFVSYYDASASQSKARVYVANSCGSSFTDWNINNINGGSPVDGQVVVDDMTQGGVWVCCRPGSTVNEFDLGGTSAPGICSYSGGAAPQVFGGVGPGIGVFFQTNFVLTSFVGGNCFSCTSTTLTDIATWASEGPSAFGSTTLASAAISGSDLVMRLFAVSCSSGGASTTTILAGVGPAEPFHALFVPGAVSSGSGNGAVFVSHGGFGQPGRIVSVPVNSLTPGASAVAAIPAPFIPRGLAFDEGATSNPDVFCVAFNPGGGDSHVFQLSSPYTSAIDIGAVSGATDGVGIAFDPPTGRPTRPTPIPIPTPRRGDSELRPGRHGG